jgi:hypothetical protein
MKCNKLMLVLSSVLMLGSVGSSAVSARSLVVPTEPVHSFSESVMIPRAAVYLSQGDVFIDDPARTNSGKEAFESSESRGHWGWGNRGCHGRGGGVHAEGTYRRCLLRGVRTTARQERVIQPALFRFIQEIETSSWRNSHRIYERFLRTVRPVLSRNQTAQVRANIDEILQSKWMR